MARLERHSHADAERLQEATRRLRHDLGKYVRLSASGELEVDTEALRERLRADVLATRSGPEGVLEAAEIFGGWFRESESFLPKAGAMAETVARIRRAVATAGRLASRIDELSRSELEQLDTVTREIAQECRRLCDDAVSAGPR